MYFGLQAGAQHTEPQQPGLTICILMEEDQMLGKDTRENEHAEDKNSNETHPVHFQYRVCVKHCGIFIVSISINVNIASELSSSQTRK